MPDIHDALGYLRNGLIQIDVIQPTIPTLVAFSEIGTAYRAYPRTKATPRTSVFGVDDTGGHGYFV